VPHGAPEAWRDRASFPCEFCNKKAAREPIGHWREIVPEEPGHHLSNFKAFKTFLAVDVEDESGTTIRVFRLPELREIPVPRPAEIGVASSSFVDDNEANLDPAAKVLRFHFSSPVQPQCVCNFDVTTAPDGERVPTTIVYRKDMRRPRGNPTLIVGYGAYGLSLRATFTRSAFSLIDRGFVYAIAHVRGGHEKGERWYAEGRMLNKRNTFTDFIAVTEMMIEKGYANSTVPLTTLEYDEWGNPAVKSEYDYMVSYSPYDNVGQKSYPAMFITAAFYDSQVSYAEPAKWVAKLRVSKTDTHELLLKTDMSAGHDGRSGRLGSIEQDAETAAWLIAHAGRRA
jgi:oligopeptidase B